MVVEDSTDNLRKQNKDLHHHTQEHLVVEGSLHNGHLGDLEGLLDVGANLLYAPEVLAVVVRGSSNGVDVGLQVHASLCGSRSFPSIRYMRI